MPGTRSRTQEELTPCVSMIRRSALFHGDGVEVERDWACGHSLRVTRIHPISSRGVGDTDGRDRVKTEGGVPLSLGPLLYANDPQFKALKWEVQQSCRGQGTKGVWGVGTPRGRGG